MALPGPRSYVILVSMPWVWSLFLLPLLAAPAPLTEPAEAVEGEALVPRQGSAASEELLRESAVKMALGEYEEARELAARAVDTDPSNPRAYLQRAALHLRLDSPAEAAEDAAKALGLRYEKPAAYCLRSEAYARQGRFQEALADAERAVGLNPNSPAGIFRRAVAREGLGAARQEVLSDLKRASELDARLRPYYEAARRRSNARKPQLRSAKRALAWALGLAAVLAAAFWALGLTGTSWRGQKARLVRFGTTLEGRRLAQEPALGSVVGGRFILDALVERTEEGAVYEGRDLSDQPRSVVRYRNREGLAERARAAAGLRHPRIAAGEALFEQGGSLYLVYQPLPGDSLRRVLEGLPERRCSPEQALRLLKPICEALEWAHGQGLSHGHLNPCCIVVDKGQVVLIGKACADVNSRPRSQPRTILEI